jgi:hypothetical protein
VLGFLMRRGREGSIAAAAGSPSSTALLEEFVLHVGHAERLGGMEQIGVHVVG